MNEITFIVTLDFIYLIFFWIDCNHIYESAFLATCFIRIKEFWKVGFEIYRVTGHNMYLSFVFCLLSFIFCAILILVSLKLDIFFM